MNKKKMLVFVAVLAGATGCGGRGYSEMKAYLLKKEINALPGSSSFLAVQMEIPARHHIYGNPKGPGTGLPTEVTARSSRDIEFRTARYLKPKKFFFPGEREHTWGYDHETRVFIPYTVSPHAKTGPRPISVLVDLLLCNDGDGSVAGTCERKRFTLDGVIHVVSKKSNGEWDEHLLKEYESSRPGGERHDGGLPGGGNGSDAEKFFKNAVFRPRTVERPVTGILHAILLAFIAGCILNVMPCVLPVVGIKVMGLVASAGGSKRDAMIHGALFSLGILVSFGILALLAALFGYQWGGLFQHEWFLIAMTSLVFALALSMAGVFVLPVPGFAGRASMRGNTKGDSFVKGFIATLLATPCSGPFLGGTLAWAMTQRPAVIAVTIMSVGMGMALPYLVLTAWPRLVTYVPKPGPWMHLVEKIMAFFLFFTVIYLLGIFQKDSLMPMLLFLGFIAVGLWQFGTFGGPDRSPRSRIVAAVLLCLIIVGGYVLSFHVVYRAEGTHAATPARFSVPRILANREAGKISVVVFTADWCPNCKVVERLALRDDEVQRILTAHDVDFMKADITRTNKDAEEMMRRLGSRSIPMVAIIPPGDAFTSPLVVRDMYSKDDILRGIEEARARR